VTASAIVSGEIRCAARPRRTSTGNMPRSPALLCCDYCVCCRHFILTIVFDRYNWRWKTIKVIITKLILNKYIYNLKNIIAVDFDLPFSSTS
jgi:hypothetical protein